MARKWNNFVDGSTSADITSSDTTLSSAGLSKLDAISGSDYVYVTLDADGSAGLPEIVQVVSHAANATTATIVRAQLGTSARSHVAGTDWAAGLYSVDLQRIDTLDAQLEIRRAALQKEFIAADQTMQRLQAQVGSLSALSGQYRLF